jgi:hypothetical protein
LIEIILLWLVDLKKNGILFVQKMGVLINCIARILLERISLPILPENVSSSNTKRFMISSGVENEIALSLNPYAIVQI